MDWCLIADIDGTLATLWMIVSVAVGLGLVIFVHELGHFLAAKACGVKVEKFYIGFDIPLGMLPSTLLKFRRGETEYGIGILPLGGYVKMLGQDDNPRNQARENERIKIRQGTPAGAEGGGPSAAAAVATAEAAAGADQASLGAGEFAWDPRSYPAKPVWQRMIIISAGVIMNLIFAVIFAALAYRQGVSYTPCIVGGTAPGNPAWVRGLNAGDKIIQIGRHGQRDEQLRFDKDLVTDVLLNGVSHPMHLLVRRAGQSDPEWISLTPTDRLADYHRPASLGIRAAASTVVDVVLPAAAGSSQDPGYRDLRPGDEIVAVDGEPLFRDPQTGLIFDHELDRHLARKMKEPIKLTVRRQAKQAETAGAAVAAAPAQTLEVTLPPTPLRMTGLVMKIGKVVGVREGSPAEKAGFRTGDVLERMEGEDIGDAVTLAQRLLERVGREVEFEVQRDGAKATLRATPAAPAAFRDGCIYGYGAPLGLESLGLAFQLTNEVADVVPGSPAHKEHLQKGDRITSVTLIKDGEELPDPIPLMESKSWWSRRWRKLWVASAEEAEKDLPNWYFVHTLLNMEPDLDLKLTYRRGPGSDSDRTVTLHPLDSDRFFYPARRFGTTAVSFVRTAESWSEAWALGYAETEVSVKTVVAFLQRLCTGNISFTNLGGPILIVRAAGSEASEGVPRLLVFLTLLSANLAVLNFLPIPALDGGHMLFLAAEGIRGKPVNERLQVTLTLIGVGCLLSLMVLVFGLDIQRLFF